MQFIQGVPTVDPCKPLPPSLPRAPPDFQPQTNPMTGLTLLVVPVLNLHGAVPTRRWGRGWSRLRLGVPWILAPLLLLLALFVKT
jgi:hypothetical protein